MTKRNSTHVGPQANCLHISGMGVLFLFAALLFVLFLPSQLVDLCTIGSLPFDLLHG
jgi:hypothetical protein